MVILGNDKPIFLNNEGTTRTKEGIAHLALATLTKGDSVIVPDPTYPVHAHAFSIAGANIVRVPLLRPSCFLKEIVKIVESKKNRPKFILVNFPSNPTGICVDLFLKVSMNVL